MTSGLYSTFQISTITFIHYILYRNILRFNLNCLFNEAYLAGYIRSLSLFYNTITFVLRYHLPGNNKWYYPPRVQIKKYTHPTIISKLRNKNTHSSPHYPFFNSSSNITARKIARNTRYVNFRATFYPNFVCVLSSRDFRHSEQTRKESSVNERSR